MPTTSQTITEILDLLESSVTEDEIKRVAGRNGRAIIIFAIGFGWSVQARGATLWLVSPDNTKMQLPQHGDLSAKTFRQKINTIVRHKGDTVVAPFSLVEMLIQALKVDIDHARVLRNSIADLTPEETSAVEDPSYVIQGRTGTPTQIIETLNPDGGHIRIFADKATREILDSHSDWTPVPRAEGTLPSADEESLPLLTPAIVREEPWTAHGKPARSGGSEVYPSGAVMEREYADGHFDYICRWPDCGKAYDNPRSTASHYSSHVRGQGRSTQPEADGVDQDWTPKQAARIKRLKRELDGALVAALAAGVDINNTEWIAAWIIEHRIEGISDSGDTTESDGPLTAEQILDKIAALADRGRAHALREGNAILHELLNQSELAREAERQHRLRVEQNFHALRELINETDTGQ